MSKKKSIIKFFKKLLRFYSIKFLLNSIRSFVVCIFDYDRPLRIFKKRKNGISVLLPTQNEEKIVKLSILSFLDFADEIIIVDNGSIDKTKEIVSELAIKYAKIKFFDKPELGELFENRQYALRKSNYRWICRFDSDYVAYTDGKNNILKLRRFLLNLPRGFRPKVISLSHINIGGDFWHIRIRDFVVKKKNEIYKGPEKRIYEYFPFFTFSRFGRREYGSFQIFMKNIVIKTIYFMHCTIKSDLFYFLRSERSNWREVGNYRKFPTLISYIKSIIKEKYNTTNIKDAFQKFLKNEIYNKNNYIKYDPNKLLPYPKLISKEMEREDIFRINEFF